MDVTLTLYKQLDILQELLNVLKQENEALKVSSPELLSDLVIQKERIIDHLNVIENQRFNQMGTMTLNEYVAQEQLQDTDLIQKYTNTMKDISHYHELNQQIATLTYEYSKDMLNALLVSAKEKSITYGRLGNMSKGNQVKTTVINRHI